MKLPERFWSKINDAEFESCWSWKAACDRLGYGRFWDGRRMALSYRLAYESLRDEIPPGLVLDHLCRNPACVNPWHLEPVTHQVNIQRGTFSNSLKTHCPQGHEYSKGNTYRSKANRRFCRTCQRNRSKSAKQNAAKELAHVTRNGK